MSQAQEKGFLSNDGVDDALLADAAELELHGKAAAVTLKIAKLQRDQYQEALEAIATLRPQVDAFFEAVMVMVPDEAMRANRLALLAKVLQDFSGIADFSEIVTQG